MPPGPTVRILTGASLLGWGAHRGSDIASGRWTPDEATNHFNFLELKAVVHAVKFWRHRLVRQSVLIELDNTTAVAYINNQCGTRSGSLARLTT